MKNTIKIFLITAAVIIAVGGIIFFSQTRMDEPTEIVSQNQFINEVVEILKKFKDLSDSPTQCDSLYLAVQHKIEFYHKENRISDAERDRIIEAFVASYVPVFLTQSFNRFDKAVWLEKDHQYMRDRIANIRAFKVKNGSVIEDNSDPNVQMNLILGTIEKYREAKSLSNKTQFMSIENARKNIDNAKSILAHQYIKKCADITNSLNALPEKIHDSHFSQIKIDVNKLSEYQILEEEEFTALASGVNKMVEDYKNHSKSLYGNTRNIAEIEAAELKQNAIALNYYRGNKGELETTQNVVKKESVSIPKVTKAAPAEPKYTQIKYSDGNSYSGYVDAKGNRHGKGKFEYRSGNKYDGDWKQNQMTGSGTYTSVDGWKYIGEFRDGDFHGNGKYYDEKGKLVREGIWENGKFLRKK